jgi:hypothetical protein
MAADGRSEGSDRYTAGNRRGEGEKDGLLTGSSRACSEGTGMTTVAGFRRRAVRKKRAMTSVLRDSHRFFMRGRSWRQGEDDGDLSLSRETSEVRRHGEVEEVVFGGVQNS